MGNLLKTRWANQVDPENPLPDYPRPQLTRTSWQNLNGLWDYAVTGHAAEEPSVYHGKILVPFPIQSSLSGVMRPFLPNETLWYKRSFNASIASDERLLLHFDAVDYETHVFINGHPVGDHKGGYSRFTFDVTGFLSAEQTNTLLVKVIDASAEAQPHGKQSLNPGGIY